MSPLLYSRAAPTASQRSKSPVLSPGRQAFSASLSAKSYIKHIGGFVRVSQRTLWLALGSEWLVIDTGAGPIHPIRLAWVIAAGASPKSEGHRSAAIAPAGKEDVDEDTEDESRRARGRAAALNLAQELENDHITSVAFVEKEDFSGHNLAERYRIRVDSQLFTSGCEVWTTHRSGRIVVWSAVPSANIPSASPSTFETREEADLLVPMIISELEGAREIADDDHGGKAYCLVQASERQVWAGTNKGRILPWSIRNRRRIELTSSNQRAQHQRSVDVLASCHASHSTPTSKTTALSWIIWSASKDETIRIFRIQRLARNHTHPSLIPFTALLASPSSTPSSSSPPPVSS